MRIYLLGENKNYKYFVKGECDNAKHYSTIQSGHSDTDKKHLFTTNPKR